MSKYTPVLPLRTDPTGNIRVDIVSDTMGLIVQYKYETKSGIVDDYIYFSNIANFSFRKLKYLSEFPSETYDCVCESSADNEVLPGAVKRFLCFFSEHGLLEVLAESVEPLDKPPPTLTEIFEKLVGNDLI
ncbi:hypothetical protein [Rhizobium laguerreae]|uniref:hypothetical protein n=1 Tax=Rhizobium laguerreae TaxID=1076926 RepID=UPI001C90E1BA|nr:hypothetical protein [Rhizobium laguerreae]MBY3314679.1 hypothetical protein [Rhizobium laguerreae]